MEICSNALRLELYDGKWYIDLIHDGIDGWTFCPAQAYKTIPIETERPLSDFDKFMKSEGCETYANMSLLPIFLDIFAPGALALLLLRIAKYGLNIPAEYSKEEQMTYVVYSEQSGLYKIGRTLHFYDEGKKSGRLTGLRCADPTIKEVLLIAKDVEYALHQKFQSKRVRGEWFSLTDEDIEEIRKYPLIEQPKQPTLFD